VKWSSIVIVDQAEKLRLMVRDAKKPAQVLTITSGKGGVGKTNIAANLALCLLACRKDVILLDADFGTANLDVVLGMKSRRNLSQVLSGRYRLEEIIETGPAGVRLVAGISGMAEMTDLTQFQRQHLIQELTTLEHQADVIIVDTGAGISSNVLSFCEAADHTLVVTTPEPTSISDAYALIKSLVSNHSGVKISLLVNMVANRNEAKKVFQRIAHVARQFLSVAIYDAGYLLRDDYVTEAVCKREPVVLAYPRAQASFCLMALAGKIGHVSSDTSEEGGFFRKVVNWLA
jgi:flagellar biosynthesis protein FlhG